MIGTMKQEKTLEDLTKFDFYMACLEAFNHYLHSGLSKKQYDRIFEYRSLVRKKYKEIGGTK